jgi:hypothetical protein
LPADSGGRYHPDQGEKIPYFGIVFGVSWLGALALHVSVRIRGAT